MRQGGSDKGRVLPQRAKDHLPQLQRGWAVLWELLIVLGAGRLMAGRDPAVRPVRLIQHFAALGYLLCSQYIGYGQ
jgi:hypothetical protein